MAKDLTSSLPLVDERGAAFGRLAARVVETLNLAVAHRRGQGETLASIADKLGCHRSVLSRVLNGTTSNLTLRTISDILWATRFEPCDFEAEAIETIAPNWVPYEGEAIRTSDAYLFVSPTLDVKLDLARCHQVTGSSFQKPQIEVQVR